MNKNEPPKKAIVLVSPNGSYVYLIDAIQPQYANWRIELVDVAPEPPVAELKQDENTSD